MTDIFHKFLDNEINLREFEEMIYTNAQLENEIGLDKYLYFLNFNYKTKYAEIEIREFILNHIIDKFDFGVWKLKRIFETNDIHFPSVNLYVYAKQNPEFLKGKKTEFKQLTTDKQIEIEWADKVYPFVRNKYQIKNDSEKYLYLGTYENSYIHLVVNQKDEIYIAYDIINKEDFWAKNIEEAIMKLILNTEM